MLERLIDKVAAQEQQEKQELPRKNKSAVLKITDDSSSKDKQISAKVNEKIYKAFTDINRAQGLSNNSALNMLISKYVRENNDILEFIEH